MNSATAVRTDWLALDGFRRMVNASSAARAFAHKVYGYLDRMAPGRSCTFARYGLPQLEWCVRTAVAFILEGEHWREYSLSEDCLTIRRERPCEGELPRTRFVRGKGNPPPIMQHPGAYVGLNTPVPKKH